MISLAIKKLRSTLTSFFRHWYIGGFSTTIFILGRAIRTIDRKLVIREMVRDISDPVASGKFKHRLQRLISLFGAAILYCLITVAFIIGYLLWVTLPPYLLYKTINPR